MWYLSTIKLEKDKYTSKYYKHLTIFFIFLPTTMYICTYKQRKTRLIQNKN